MTVHTFNTPSEYQHVLCSLDCPEKEADGRMGWGKEEKRGRGEQKELSQMQTLLQFQLPACRLLVSLKHSVTTMLQVRVQTSSESTQKIMHQLHSRTEVTLSTHSIEGISRFDALSRCTLYMYMTLYSRLDMHVYMCHAATMSYIM